MSEKKCACGIRTNEPSGICAICKINGVTRPTPPKKEEITMAKNKVCGQCGTEYSPKSNRQQFCSLACQKAAWTGSVKEKGRTQKAGPAVAQKPATAETPQEVKRVKMDEKSQSTIAEPKANAVYIIEVDLTPYPALHGKLIKLAEDEYRTPDMQLAKLLKEEFDRREQAV